MGEYLDTRPIQKAEIIDEAKSLFKKIDDWFFGTDSTHFDPTYLESLEDFFQTKGYLTLAQLKDLRDIYKTWVLS